MRHSEKRKGAVLLTAIHVLVILLLCVYLLLPFTFMVSRSLMNVSDVTHLPYYFFPTEGLHFENYYELLVHGNYFHYTWNTLKIAVFNMVVVTLSSSICGYAFGRMKWKGRDFWFALVMGTLMIPGSITQIPLYVLFADLGWVETAYPLTIPAIFGGGAIYIFLFRQFMMSLPKELEEAARIDGANVFRCYIQIIMPLCGAIAIYVLISTFNGVWGDFTGPLVYLKQAENYTLAVAIYQDSINKFGNAATGNLRMAAGVFMSLVPALLFLIYQRKLVDGIMVGAVKG